MQKIKYRLTNQWREIKPWLQLYLNVAKALFFILKLKLSAGRKPVVVIALFEHIGDIIACEPVIRNAKQQYPGSKIVWCVNKAYSSLLQYHSVLDGIIGMLFFTEWILLRKKLQSLSINIKIIDLHLNGRKCVVFKEILRKEDYGVNFQNYLNKSILQSFSVAAGLHEIDEPPLLFYNSDIIIDLPKPYIVLHTSTNTEIKDWQPYKWQQLADALIKKGFYVVEIGTKKAIYTESKYYKDKTGKLDLQHIASIVVGSRLFIGCDSGFAHMANAMRLNGLVLIGEYKLDVSDVFRQYNPFTGLYKSSDYIIYPKVGLVSEISVDAVVTRAFDKLQISTDKKICFE